MSMSAGRERRRATRKDLRQWIEFGVVDPERRCVTNSFQTCARDVSPLGLGLLAADPVEIGGMVAIQLRQSVKDAGALKFGVVRTTTSLGQWTLLGIEFVEAPAWAEGSTVAELRAA